jgi:putative ABC transport system permease protein
VATRRPRLLLRWSWRDLRHRWGVVVLTAIIIAIGTGTFAGLGGTSAWRVRSQDASYAALRYHDLRVRLPVNVDVPEGDLAAAIGSIPDADQVAVSSERLIVPIQIDASSGGRTVLVPGEIVGMDPKAAVDQLHLSSGRMARAGEDEAVLEAKFVEARDLPSSGSIEVSGGRRLRITGTGFTPEYFQVLGSAQQVTGAYGFGVVFVPLATAQSVAGKEGRVNDAVVRLRAGADEAVVADQIEAALADSGATVETRADDAVHRSLYADARNDAKTWTALSLLLLLGASFAAFNLVTRMVEAERHEIGVAMALGAPPWRLAIRPLLVGLQISVMGVLLGLLVGVGAGAAMRGLLVDLLPLPVWRTPFPIGRYLQAAALGIALPMLATAIPVRRALRVEPVEALRSQSVGVRRRAAGLAPRLARPRHRGRVVGTMPFRNVVRNPRRTILTALGIAASITTLVAVLGMLDSFAAAFDRSDAEVGRTHGDRLEVALSNYQPAGSDLVRAIASSPAVGSATPQLRIGGTLRRGDAEVDTILDLVDFGDDRTWVPSVVEGTAPVGRPGLVISETAAANLGVGPGDTVELEHPVRDGASYRMVRTRMQVAGVHPNPLRFYTYLDTSQVGLFDLDGIVNQVAVEPAAGASASDVQRALFVKEGVTSVQEVAVLGRLLEDRLAQFTGILRILEGFGLALALLISLNSATLTMEERRREQATMFAFGLPVRTVLRTIVVETFLMAVLGTAIGIGTGYLALRWLLSMFTTTTFPELGLVPTVSPGSLVLIVVLGVGVATLAPVLAVRRLLRTDIPSTLRVLE